MKFQIIEEKENPLLKRKEILISVDYEGGATPSKAYLQKSFAEHFKVGIEKVEVTKILSETGLAKGKALVKIWQDKKVPIYSEIKKEKAEKPVEKKEKPKEEKPKETKEEPKGKE